MLRFALALALVMCGCGGSDPIIDPPDEDLPGPIDVVTMENDGTPIANAIVFTNAADGSFHASAVTDAQGKATAEVPPGGSVSVADVTPGLEHIETVLDVAPGETITFGPSARGVENEVSVSAPMVGGASGYSFYNPCQSTSGASTMATLSHDASCVTGPYSILATASDGSSPVNYQFVDDVLPNATTADLIGTWQPFGTYGVSVTDLPIAGQLFAQQRTGRGGTFLYFQEQTNVDQNQEMFTMDIAPMFGETYNLGIVQVTNASTLYQGFTQVDITLDGGDVTVSADEFLTVSSPDANYDTASRRVTFAAPVTWTATRLDIEVEAEIGSYNWEFNGAGNQAEVTLPDLAPELADWEPTAVPDVSPVFFEASIDITWPELRVMPQAIRRSLEAYPSGQPFDVKWLQYVVTSM